ncbi:MAG: class I SAM-dependent methyltransferase [Phycisphaerae bacterium]|jgi:cyclopropane fatty-acyl-phospholipid synthase-like methyltransferase
MSRKKIIQAHYEPRIEPGRANHEILDWADAASQRARFEVLTRSLDLSGRSLLDVGCGLGDLLAFCGERGIDVDYTGVDLVEKMVHAARQIHPSGRFECVDIFAGQRPHQRRYDVVFCSGVFNLDVGNNRDFLPQAVARLLEIARQAVVVNLLHHRTARRYDHCYYYDPQDVRAMLSALPCDCRIVDDYLPNDFTVICTPRVRG